LTGKGIKVIMTRSDENSLSDEKEGKTLREMKKEDMNKRLSIIKESNARLGSFLVSQVQYFCFSINNVYKLKQLIQPIKHKILPSYFSRICGTTSLIIFLLKDALEYCGALINENKSHPKHRVDNLTYEKELIVNLLHQLKHKYTNKFN
jgi:hypothetical protein